MSDHLVLITLGPVQEFIAQARRTRDLWYGSHVLSELARAGAKALTDGGARLVFPAFDHGDAELDPCDAPLRPNATPPLSVPNRILAVAPAPVDPRALATAVRSAASARLRHLAAVARKRVAALLAPDAERVWDEQVDSTLEFAATWAPLTATTRHSDVRRELEAELAARKGLRDFDEWVHRRAGAPKSSLDGARDSLLVERSQRQREARVARKYRIGDNEQLDAIGLLKRAGGEPDQFVPLANVALAAYLDEVHARCPAELDGLRRACADLEEHCDLGRVRRDDIRWIKSFPYDAQLLLEDRWGPLFEELGLEPADGLAWGKRNAKPLLDAAPGRAPYPYVGCLVADGDSMGQTLDELGFDDQRKLSTRLAEFASRAREIVEQRHRGMLVYAGGDDVLAFLPLKDALPCAQALAGAFEQALSAVIPPGVKRPTLSVGLGIGHVLESMGELLDLGRAAERLAKGASLPAAARRNALAVIVDKRSGGRTSWRARWDANPDPVASLTRAVEHIDGLRGGRLSHKKVYEIRECLGRLPAPGPAASTQGSDGASADSAGWLRVLTHEVTRILGRTYAGGPAAGPSIAPALGPGDVGLILAGSSYAEVRAAVAAWVDCMLVARVLAEGDPSAPDRADGGRP